MSTPENKIHAEQKILDFYTQHLKEHGSSPQGVGWKDDQAQLTRFEQLSKIVQDKDYFTINDLGCGTGRFYDYLKEKKFYLKHYFGYDILDEMLGEAAKNILPNDLISLRKILSSSEMLTADYTIASGIFNVKYEAEERSWLEHILETLQSMNSKSVKGFAFNLLTSYSDKEFMQSYLYYADPLFFFDFCKRNFSKNVSLLHDYNQYDFTILVRRS